MADVSLSLVEARRLGQMEQFVCQEEARGIGPADPRALDALVAEADKERPAKDQASHFPSRDVSTGKQIRRGNDPCVSHCTRGRKFHYGLPTFHSLEEISTQARMPKKLRLLP